MLLSIALLSIAYNLPLRFRLSDLLLFSAAAFILSEKRLLCNVLLILLTYWLVMRLEIEKGSSYWLSDADFIRCSSCTERCGRPRLSLMTVVIFLLLTRRARCGMGGDHHPSPRQRALRLSVGHHPQRAPVCWVDLSPALTGTGTFRTLHSHVWWIYVAFKRPPSRCSKPFCSEVELQE